MEGNRDIVVEDKIKRVPERKKETYKSSRATEERIIIAIKKEKGRNRQVVKVKASEYQNLYDEE